MSSTLARAIPPVGTTGGIALAITGGCINSPVTFMLGIFVFAASYAITFLGIID